MRRFLLLLLAFATACSSSSGDPTAVLPNLGEGAPRETVVVPLSLHVMVEQDAPASELSSSRSPDELRAIATSMGAIWAQADVIFDPINVHRVEVPAEVLQGILLGSTDQFFDQVNNTFAVENGQAINGFYVRSALGVNGFTPQGSNLFFVIDEPSVNDERVSSHEVGHIFGLRHDLDDPSTLMFSGTNGTRLTELEQTVARYSVQGLFPQGIDA